MQTSLFCLLFAAFVYLSFRGYFYIKRWRYLRWLRGEVKQLSYHVLQKHMTPSSGMEFLERHPSFLNPEQKGCREIFLPLHTAATRMGYKAHIEVYGMHGLNGNWGIRLFPAQFSNARQYELARSGSLKPKKCA